MHGALPCEKSKDDSTSQAVFLVAKTCSGSAIPCLKKLAPVQILSRGTVGPQGTTKLKPSLKAYGDVEEKHGMSQRLGHEPQLLQAVLAVVLPVALHLMQWHPTPAFINAPSLALLALSCGGLCLGCGAG